MAQLIDQTTTVSTKGQIILPVAIRRQRRWDAGTRLIIEEVEGGVLLRAAPVVGPSRIEDVFGMLSYAGPAITLDAMNAAVAAEAARARN